VVSYDTEALTEMIEKEKWPHNSSPNLNAVEISCLASDVRNYFETFIRSPKQFLKLKVLLERIWDNFPQVQLTNLFHVKGDERHSEHFSQLEKVFPLTVFALS